MEYYEILEVDKNASLDAIKKQYKKLALKYHPDRGGDPEKFKQLSEAYQTLSNPEKRRQYDAPNPFQNFGASNQAHFVDPNIFFQQFFNNNEMFRQQSTSFNINISGAAGMPPSRGQRGRQVFQKSVSTRIQGDNRIETTTEIRNGVKTQTVKQTNIKTGKSITNINQITS